MNVGKNVTEHRLDSLESAVTKISDAINRLTALEEHYVSAKESFSRAFTRIEGLESSVNGTPEKPGIYAHILLIEAQLKMNMAMTKTLLGLMATTFVSGIGYGFYVLLHSAGIAP